MTKLSKGALSIVVAAMGALMCAAPSLAAPPAAQDLRADLPDRAVQPAQYSIQFGIGRPYYGPRYYGGYGGYYRPYYRPYYYDAPPPPVVYYQSPPYAGRPPVGRGDPDAIARCASRFKSFNARTGTYVTYEGEERLCPYLR